MASTLRQGDPAEFTVFGRRMTAKLWGSADGTPTFLVHGWLDNANSFDRLAPLLPELNLVALDLAGHGESDHRPQGVHYHQVEDVQDILAIADQLGWQRFNLIGHSMGGQIASELSALFPERVFKAFMIDGFVATGGVSAAERVEQTRLGVEKMLMLGHSSPKVFASVTEMAQRVTEATDQSLEAASTLVARGHKVVEGGVTWRSDPCIRYPSPLRHSREFLNELLSNCTVPCLLLVAEQGDKWYQGEIEVSKQYHPNLIVRTMSGPHHIHLEVDYVEDVAEHVRDFLGLAAHDTSGVSAG